MRVIIAGSRTITDEGLVFDAVEESGFYFNEIVSGGARGVDSIGEKLAERLEVPLEVFDADWDKFGNAAGPIRNGEMANYGDALIAVWDGRSTGTKDMIEQAHENGLKVFVKFTDGRTKNNFEGQDRKRVVRVQQGTLDL